MSRQSTLATTSYSIVMEMENAHCVSPEELRQTLLQLAEQMAAYRPFATGRPEVIISHAGEPTVSPDVMTAVGQHVPQLLDVADVVVVSVPQGRYYELKNAGIERARGEIIVLLDSDMSPQPGWLAAILDPFANEQTTVVSGQTYLGLSGFVSRTIALAWIFPLRTNDDKAIARRPLSVNNCAFRGAWIRANPIPIDNGFKVGCTKLMHRMEQSGVKMQRVPALGEHKPLQGWRFLVWRALVTGRDADRKYEDLKSPSRSRRLFNALKFCFKMQCRSVRRILTLRRHVALPLWQVPAAVVVSSLFYALALLGQLKRIAGLDVERPEYIPSYVESH